MNHTRILGRLVSRCLTGVLWFGLAHSTPMPGQVAGGTIQGVVSDPSGATVAGAQVTVTGKATGLKREVSSNSTGFYAVPDLQPAAYTVTVASKRLLQQGSGQRDFDRRGESHHQFHAERGKFDGTGGGAGDRPHA